MNIVLISLDNSVRCYVENGRYINEFDKEYIKLVILKLIF